MSNKVEVLSAVSIPFLPGTLVAGKYRIERPLGQGGMGYVVLARHVQLDQLVALKFMHAWLANESPRAAARFLGEARAAARIRSDHVARVTDTGTLEDGSPYMVMEYLEGQDLDSLLQERKALPVSMAISYALQASEGLGEAHAAGIVHRDLKPSNLFLARQTDGSVRIKLLDFGISKVTSASVSSNPPPEAGDRSSVLFGSPLYMSPEQMRATGSADQRTDIWGLGVVLYEMLTATPPFVGNTLPEIRARVFEEPPVSLRTLRADVPLVLDQAVLQCLEKDPQRRFQSVAALARALAPFGTPEAATAAERIDRIMRRPQRRVEDAVSEPPDVANVTVPPPTSLTSLTRTSFGRAVDRVASLMRPAGIDAHPPREVPTVVSAQMAMTRPSLNRARRTRFRRGGRSRLLLVSAAGLGLGAAFAFAGVLQWRNLVHPTNRRAGETAPTPSSIAIAAPMPTTPPSAMTVVGLATAPTSVSLPRPAPPTSTTGARRPTPAPIATSNTARIGTSGFGGRE